MIDDDVITRLTELHDGITAPPTAPGADVSRGKWMLRRRRMVVGGAAAAVVVAVLGIVAATGGGPQAGDRIEPVQPSPTESPHSTQADWPLERIRAEGSVVQEDVMSSGIRTRVYYVCDGTRNECEVVDPPLRAPYVYLALEVTQDGRSALFDLSDNGPYRVQAFDKNSVLAVENPSEDWKESRAERHRVLRANGTEVTLHRIDGLAPAVPGPDLVVVDYGEDGLDGQEDVYLVNLHDRTLQLLDVPRLAGIESLDARHWGPNVDEFLWFADRNCTVQWAAEDGTFTKSEPDCKAGWDPPTYIHDDMFPDGWLQPGRLALLERNDHQLFVHVSLDYGSTWQRIPVSGEGTVPDALRQLG